MALLITLIILTPLLAASAVNAQVPTPHYVVFYAHSYGDSATLNALAQWAGQQAAEFGRGLTFRLKPVLGGSLHVYGGITFVLYLRASMYFFGTVNIQLSELGKNGVEAPVPGARVESPLTLDTRTVPVTLGVGVIDHEFQAGASIVLHITVDRTSGSGNPLLVWDDSTSPTSLRLPVINPTRVELSFSGETNFGHVFQADSAGKQFVRIRAVAFDAIGAYRFTYAGFQVTAPNGTSSTVQAELKNDSAYSFRSSLNMTLDRGQWDVGFMLRDLSGESYRAVESLWVTPFYRVSINVVRSDGGLLGNVTVNVSFRKEATWSASTNATGWGSLSLPSSQILGPLNVTIVWLGTETLSTLDVVGASTFLLRIPVSNLAVRITLGGVGLPVARVVLLQKGVVREEYTWVNGVANFGMVPQGNYTLRVDYLLVTYQSQLSVKADEMLTVAVPLLYRTAFLIGLIAALSIASAFLVRRRRLKLYPQSFGYFQELTRGGLQQACFAVVFGNSGSGKSVLLNSLAAEHLAVGKCVYVTNTDFPEKIQESMVRLGICDAAAVKPDRLFFVDAYSAIGGSSPRVEYFVASHTDLTSLGLNISKCLELAGPGTDVYLDSLNPLLTALRIDVLINFLQSVAAKVKANNGKLCATIGTGIEKGDMAKLEEAADCVIETQLQETSKGQRRRLRIKKLRDKPYVDRWTRFQVEAGKGIIFLTSSKPI